MKRYRIPIAVALVLLPVIARAVWFYQGVYWRSATIATPDYGAFTIPEPPLSTPAEPVSGADASRAIIRLDQMHGNRCSPSELESLTGILQSRGARLESVAQGGYDDRVLADQLKYASAYMTVCPLLGFSTSEIQQLLDFVRRGGRLLVLTDPTRSTIQYDYYGYGSASVTADITAANSLLAPFDIAFLDDYLYNMSDYEGNYRNVFFRDFPSHPMTQGLSTVVLYAAHSLQTATGTVLIQSSPTTKSSRTDADGVYPVAALDAGGGVLAVGDMTFLQPPYNQVADNAVLIRRLSEFLLGAPRVHDLNDFPFLFQREVAIVPMEDIALSGDLLGPIRSLQQDLSGAGINAQMGTAPAAGKDLILLGTFSSAKIGEYLAPHGIRLPSQASISESGYPQIEIPGFGSVPAFGIGLILFTRTESRSTLVLLAENSTLLTDLMGVIGPEGFSNCVLQGGVAVCGLGSGYGDFEESWWQPFETVEPGSSGTPTGPAAVG
jgi:hypothetical protein